MPRRVAAVLAVVLATLAAAGTPAHARFATLPDGFRVADGTRLVGPVFPKIGDVTGWTAVFDVDTDAVTAFNAYQVQLGDAGFRQVFSACEATGAEQRTDIERDQPGVACTGSYLRGPDTRVRLAVLVCEACGEAALVRSTGIFELVRLPTDRWAAPQDHPIELASGPELQLTDEQRAQLRSATRAARRSAEASPPAPTRDDLRVMNPRLFGATGARLVSPSTSFGDRCQPDETTVMRASGNPEDVLDRLAADLRATSEGDWSTHRSTQRSATIVQRSDDYRTLTLVDAPGRSAYILASLCSD